MDNIIEQLECDKYQDCIILMDEAQMHANHRWLISGINNMVQHEWTVLILPTVGHIDIEVAGEPYACSKGQLLTALLSEGIVLRHMSDDFAAKTICMSLNFVQGLDLDDTISSGLAVRRHPLNNINEEMFHAVELIFDQLRGIIARDDNPYRYLALQLMVTTYNYTIGYYLRSEADTICRTAEECLCDQFTKMAEHDFKEHRDVEYYAQKLCVSKQYLSTAVTHTTGMTVTHHIARHVVIYAKKRLAHSALSVEQIAEELHFVNPSHFGTYFKRMVGMSPAAYRKAKRKE